ncbi:MAG: tRNA 2-thiocytidine(32) synthetase TtcA [Desulfuromonas sp.]|nr:MAG: tRNA 2-thiocytidine(32) synthetase TtcA [Desulfuromonas sp.]
MAPLNTALFRRLRKLTGKAIGDFNLIEEGDRIAVGVSGGKDSYSLLHLLDTLRRRAPIHYELVAVNVDAGFPGFRSDIIAAHLEEHGFAHRIEVTDCASIINEKLRPGSSYCAFCARLRRGVLYTVAQEIGCNKIALGHHLDDFIETLLLNQFYVGTLGAMSAKLLADNGRQTVIRPLVYIEEKDIAAFCSENTYPVVCCSCPDEARSDQKRQKMKQLIASLAADNKHLKQSMLGALGNVHPRHLLDEELKDLYAHRDKETLR